MGPAQRDRAEVRAGPHSGFLETLTDFPGGDWLDPGAWVGIGMLCCWGGGVCVCISGPSHW